MTNKDWTDLLREKMEAHEAPVPDGLWEEIESNLPESPAAKSSFWTPIRRYAAAAAITALLIGGAGLLWLHDGEEKNEAPIALEKHQTSDADTQEDTGIINHTTADATGTHDKAYDTAGINSVVHLKAKKGRMEAENTTGEAKTIGEAGEPKESTPYLAEKQFNQPDTLTPSIPAQTDLQTDIQTDNRTDTKTPTPTIQDEEKRILQALDDKGHQQHANPRQQRHSTNGQLGLFAANMFSSSNTSNDFGNSYYMYDYLNKSYSGVGMMDNYANSSLYHTVVPLSARENQTYDTHEEAHHHYPISFGLSYRQPITQHLSLQTGLVYTRLRSDFEARQIIGTVQREQTLHYVGIPVSITYNLWQHTNWSFYANGGAQADLNVKATEKSNGNSLPTEKDRLQMSVLFGLGGQYDITPHLGLFVEPSLRYYFNNGSGVKNYFKDEPWKVSLHLGLRLTPFSH